MSKIPLLLLLGLIAGVASGLMGIGGATITIPALIFLFGFNQHTAQGTTLAMMVLPIGFLAALTYYRAGYADLRVAALLAIGFFFGGLIGAKWATALPALTLQRIFGIGLLLIAVRMIVGR